MQERDAGVVGRIRRSVVRIATFFVKSFQAKLVLLVLLSVLVPSGVIWLFTIRDTERFQTEQTKEKFNAVLNTASRDVNYWYKDRLNDLARLLQSNGFLTPVELFLQTNVNSQRDAFREEIKQYFVFVRDKFPVYQDFIVLDRENSVVVSTSPLSFDESTFLEQLQNQVGQATFVSSVQFDDRGHAFQWILSPIDRSDGRPVVVCVKLRLDGLIGLLSPDRYESVGDLYLVDRAGRYITQPADSPSDEETGQSVSLVGEPISTVLNLAERDGAPLVERYTKEVMKGENRRRKIKYLGSWVYLVSYDWWLVCESEESTFIAPVVTRKHRILLANVLICALFVLGAWKMSRYLVRPLRDLSDGAGKINAGTFDVDIPRAGGDEIGQVIDAFNDMAKQIGLTKTELQNKAKQLQTKNDELSTVNTKLERLSVTDGLTGLFNHRHFWQLLSGELTRANRYTGELGLVLFDIDNFKKVNDQFGHAAGDHLIQKIANIVREAVRETDLVARYGGEEFAILLPDASRDGVLSVSEKVRQSVQEMVFKIPETDITMSVTVSVGVSVFRGNRREFFNAADRALYLSKKHGKNQVHFEMAVT